MDRIAEIRKRLEKATPGPWGCYDGYSFTGGFMKVERIGPVAYEGIVAPPGHPFLLKEVDGEFISHAPSDMAYLLELVKKQGQLVAQLEAMKAFALDRFKELADATVVDARAKAYKQQVENP